MRLPIYPAPEEGEVLSSYLIRLALANGMRPMSLTTLLGLKAVWKRDPDVSVTPEEMAVIAEATGLLPEQLLACSVMPLLEHLHKHPRSDASPRYLVMTGKHRGVQETRGHPICTACVRETGVVLREWRLTTSMVCERHGLPLVDTCPACQTPIHHTRRHMNRAHRLRVMSHHPDICSACDEPFPDPEPLGAGEQEAALRVQRLMAQATQTGTVTWGGMDLSAHEFEAILESALRLHYPRKEVTGRGKWRPEICTLQQRRPVMIAGGQDMAGDLLGLLHTWRARGVRPHEVMWAGLPGWFRDMVMLALATDPRSLTPVRERCKTFRFTERQWRIVSPLLPPVPPTSKGRRKSDRHVLCAWLTLYLKATRQKDWTGAWTGQVSYPALRRRITRMMEEGVLDRVVGCMLTELPECHAVLTTPGLVYDLTRMGSRHAERLWKLMMEREIAGRFSPAVG